MVKIKYLILMAVILLAACSMAAEPPMEVMSEAEIHGWQAETIGFFEKNMANWPDIDPFYAVLAEDATFDDPSDGDFLLEGKTNVKTALRTTTSFCPDVEIEMTRMFISGDGAAYDNIWHNLWPPWVPEPGEHPLVHQLDLIRFQDGLVAAYTIIFSKETQEMTGFGCFAVDKCPELREIVDRYLAAWSSGDEGQVAALYSEDAVFSDSLLGLGAVGPGAIADLVSQRFGPIGDTTLEEIGLYTQTNGPDAPTDEQPEMGRIVGVGIHYQWYAIVEGESNEVESLTTFYLNEGGLITREEVFHDPDSFLAAGLAP